jgi:hypothetical protein
MEPIFLGELLAKFYRLNEEQQPLVFQFIEDPRQAIPEKVWYAVMRGSFFIEIIEGRNKPGPHQTKLWFRTFSHPQKSHWIATLQLMAFYFNEAEVREALLKAVADREFFMTEQNRERMITP